MLSFTKCLWSNRELWWQLAKRDVLGRYRGSQLGLGWSIINPLLMLAVYTFVFSQVFKARWGNIGTESPWIFAINLFSGLIVFNLLAECANKAPALVLANPNYVKKVIFPLEILGAVSVASAVFHGLMSLGVLLIFKILVFGNLPSTTLLLPIIWAPLVLGCLAISWLLSAVGVFIRDISQMIGTLTSMLMFLSPVFYPLSAVPQSFQWLLAINPLAQVIEQTRDALILGKHPSAWQFFIEIIISLVACELSFRIFRRIKPTFADVI